MSLKQQLEEALTTFWDENAIHVSDSSSSAKDYVAALDSLSAVEVLVVVDKIVGREIDAEAVIRKGGYDTKEQFVAELTGRVLEIVGEDQS